MEKSQETRQESLYPVDIAEPKNMMGPLKEEFRILSRPQLLCSSAPLLLYSSAPLLLCKQPLRADSFECYRVKQVWLGGIENL